MKYEINTDSASQTIEATNGNHAANRFDRSISTLAQLAEKVSKMGGWMTVKEDGVVIARVSEEGKVSYC